MAKANVNKWKVNNIDSDSLYIEVPADDLLGRRRTDGKRPFKLPMRKIIEKLRQKCPGERRQWDYGYVDLSKDGTTLTFKMQR